MDEYYEKYKSYTIEELESVLLSIDKVKYPERYELAKTELGSRTLEKQKEIVDFNSFAESTDIKVDLASLSDRLAAAFVDGFIIGIPFMAALIAIFGFNGIKPMIENNRMLYFVIVTIIVQLFYLTVNGRLLYKYGQTIGKKYLEIKIVDLNNKLPVLSSSYGLRYFIPALFSFVPFIGRFLALIDILFIFRKDRRCIHDHIAGTKVIKV